MVEQLAVMAIPGPFKLSTGRFHSMAQTSFLTRRGKGLSRATANGRVLGEFAAFESPGRFSKGLRSANTSSIGSDGVLRHI